MSTLPAVTMQDLELEHAELLPRRETLCTSAQHPAVSLTNVVAGNGNGNGNGDGNVSQAGLLNFAVGGGNLSGDGNGNTIVIG
jgi:hypothetical protein